MELKNMNIDELEARKAAIATELDAPEADLEALNEEVRSINAEIEQRKADATKREEIRKAAAVSGTVIKEFKPEVENTMTEKEVRNSQDYINAYANYIKSGDDRECRALLTENASGVLPVPELVADIVGTAWEKNEILNRVRKTNFKGNLKVAFELSATGAVVHTEGTSAPSEEDLTLGIVTMIPANIKKWIRISDEAVAMGGEAFLRYVYDELTYQIIKKLAGEIVGDIAGASTSSSSTAVGVPAVAQAPSVVAIPTALSYLSEDAVNPVVILNRQTEAAFVTAFAAGNFAVDPFAGLTKIYSGALPAYDDASEDDVYAIVGDLSAIQVNYPEGEGVVIKYDDLSESQADMVKIVGRQYAAHAIVAPGRLVNLTVPAEEGE